MEWGYINARVRGMKSRLLDHRTLDSLILQPDLDSLMGALEKTPYRDDLIEARGKYTGMPAVEYAIRTNFVRTFRKILGFAGKEAAERYILIFLHRWDVQNIKTILRGKNIHVTNDEIQSCLVPAGELDEAALGEILRQQDVRSVIDLLATWELPWAEPLTEAFLEYTGTGDFALLECALDRFYYDDALRSAGGPGANNGMIRNILATEIDVVNIKTVLRMIRDHVGTAEAEKYLLSGGKELDAKRLSLLLASPSIGEAIAGLSGTRYRFLADIPEPVLRSQKISAIEKELERYLVREGARSFLGDPLSIASLIGSFWAKYNETVNLRIISRCKTADFPAERLREELIYV